MASPGPSDGGGSFSSYYDNGAKFNPTTAVVIIVLIAACFVLAFVSVMVRRCLRGDVAVAQTGGSPQSGSYQSKARGLEKADVDALPLVQSGDLGEKDDHECPVCLTDFQPDETLRLLPSCKHVFHRECIDMWFDSHSTCPLCRASLVGGDADKNPPPHDAEHVHDSIVEVSENGDSDAEVHDGSRRDLVPLEDPRIVVRASEDERTSARGMLFRNSESFKRAARGVEESESAAAEADLEKKPAETMRRSSSLSADLISLRNLLMGADQSGNPASSASSRWFARAKSLEHASRERAVQNEYTREPTRDEWVTIDLETGKAASLVEQIAPTTTPTTPTTAGESSSEGLPAPERSWSDRFSLSSLKNLASLSRSTSDVSSRHAPHLPI